MDHCQRGWEGEVRGRRSEVGDGEAARVGAEERASRAAAARGGRRRRDMRVPWGGSLRQQERRRGTDGLVTQGEMFLAMPPSGQSGRVAMVPPSGVDWGTQLS